jgi:hypothetical protein
MQGLDLPAEAQDIAEIHRVELATIYLMEYDSEALEYYDQPPPLTLTYSSPTDRKVTVRHIPEALRHFWCTLPEYGGFTLTLSLSHSGIWSISRRGGRADEAGETLRQNLQK